MISREKLRNKVIVPPSVQTNHPGKAHPGFGDRSRLVDTQYVHPGQGLDAAHFMNCRMSFRQAHHAQSQGYAGQKIEPFRNHAHQRRDDSHCRVRKPQLHQPVLLPEQKQAHRDQENRNHTENFIQRLHHLRPLSDTLFPGLHRQPRHVGIGPHMRQLCQAPPRQQKASGF